MQVSIEFSTVCNNFAAIANVHINNCAGKSEKFHENFAFFPKFFYNLKEHF